ncbi:MAG: ABC transporter ATP-binding protein/permease [Alphaproteobacteria bacterium]|nr:ABC transporter ATP-binding protein/permease [Alphaproteobacteria bacterium]
MLRAIESLLDPTGARPEPPPVAGVLRFYWHYARQARFLFLGLFAAGLAVALLDTAVPVCLGRAVALVSSGDPAHMLADNWRTLLGMAALLLILRPLAMLADNALMNQALNPGLSNMIRWQAHWHVIRQSWTFFQNDFAGRIANRVMQTGPALRETVVGAINAVWYILVFGGSAIFVLAKTDFRLATPLIAWFALYACLLRLFVPRLRARSHRVSELRSMLTGRVVDSYTNVLTVKLFARARDEDAFVREAIDQHTQAFRDQTRLATLWSFTLSVMNAALVVGTGGMSIWLWSIGAVKVSAVAMSLPLSWQISSVAAWVATNLTNIFENIGTVTDGMRSIDVPRLMADRPDATELRVTRGEIRFEDLHFGYGTERGVLHGIDIRVAPGERVGLVGASGAGKSTLVNLLLGFYEPEAGRILIDGQDIATVTQESLRAKIAMVTQDTSLLHRSIRDNIRYGRPEASDEEVERAARQAEAHRFILSLEDWHDRRGYDAHVGERGVKLSGGQRQRIALARVILKDAPILVLDEATSALDSEVEAAIQEQLDGLMRGRTVIAIAHRLSTIARMDRLLVLDRGRIVESGSHAALLERGGTYARLWQRQSGGFRSRADPAILDTAITQV